MNKREQGEHAGSILFSSNQIRVFSLLILFLGVVPGSFLFGCGSTGTTRADGGSEEAGEREVPETTVELRFVGNNTLAVQGTLNGGEEQLFLLDPLARSSYVIRENVETPFEEPGENVYVESRLDSLSVGEVELQNVRTRVYHRRAMPFGNRFDERVLGQVAGLLGYSFLNQFAVTLDFANRELTLKYETSEPVLDVEEMKIPRDRGESRFRLVGTRENQRYALVVEAALEGKEQIPFMIDPIETANVLFRDVFERLDLDLLSPRRVAELYSPQLRNEPFSRINKIWFGGRLYEDITARVLPSVNHPAGQEGGGVLGIPFLQDMSITINYPHRLLDIQTGS